MDDKMKLEYEAQEQDLRLELKAWEVDWSNTHDGKKPPRDAIKANPDIGTWQLSYFETTQSDILQLPNTNNMRSFAK